MSDAPPNEPTLEALLADLVDRRRALAVTMVAGLPTKTHLQWLGMIGDVELAILAIRAELEKR